MQRAAMAARKAGWGSVKIIVDLNQQRMELLLGDAIATTTFENAWDQEL